MSQNIDKTIAEEYIPHMISHTFKKLGKAWQKWSKDEWIVYFKHLEKQCHERRKKLETSKNKKL